MIGGPDPAIEDIIEACGFGAMKVRCLDIHIHLNEVVTATAVIVLDDESLQKVVHVLSRENLSFSPKE